MTAEQNKAIVRRWYKDMFERGNLNLAEELFTTDFISHDTSGPGPKGEWPRGPSGPRAVVKTYHDAFPDMHYSIDDLICEGDRVVVRWTARGTNTGPIMDMPATGKAVTISGIETDRLVNGKIAEAWVNFDLLSLLTQVGIVSTQNQSGR